MGVEFGTVLQNIATGEVGIASGIIYRFFDDQNNQTLYEVWVPITNEDEVFKTDCWAGSIVRVLPVSEDLHQSLYNKEEDVMEEDVMETVKLDVGNVVFHIPTQRLGIIIDFFGDEGEDAVMVAVSNTRYEDWDLEDVKLIATNEDVLAAFSDVK